jgi:hypothetical protein
MEVPLKFTKRLPAAVLILLGTFGRAMYRQQGVFSASKVSSARPWKATAWIVWRL